MNENYELLKSHLTDFTDKVYKNLGETWHILDNMPKYPIYFSDDLHDTEHWFDVAEKVIYISFGHQFHPMYDMLPYIYYNEYQEFIYDSKIGGFYTDSRKIYFESTILHEIAHGIVDFIMKDFDNDVEDDHGPDWKRWYRYLRERWVNLSVPPVNRVAFGATKFTSQYYV